MKLPLRTSFVTILFFASFHIATAQKITTPIQLNNYLTGITDTLYKYGQEWGTQLSSSFTSKNFGLLTPFRTRIEEYASKKIVEITAMKNIGGSENFKAAMLEFLTYEKKTVTTYFIPFEKLDSSSTDDNVQKHMNDLIAVGKDESTALQKVNDAQKEYAAKNGFVIEKRDEQN